MPVLTPTSVAVLRTEARLFLREPSTLFWVLAFPTLLLVALGLVPGFREADENIGGRRVIDLYAPTAVLIGLISAGLQTQPTVLTGYREKGILRRMRTTPARPADLLAAQIALHAVAVVLSTLLVLAVGRLAFGIALPEQPLGYAVALALAVLAVLAMGAVITAFSRTVRVASAVGMMVFFPAMFAAGVYVPIQVLPDPLLRVLELTPFGAATQALDQAATGGWPAWSLLAVLAVWAAGLTAVAARWFRWE
ncbi:ABC transporter permease [Allostreptomyces psammosilenae]|uniref:Transport permease protein n=1 Tax=Allostreptomyces psammosilenae TaxID=1892865 RepID=A0A852ZZS2_9ACTN|nr:ABC transporter permease [Allostreptomyces psammosilenae]NYI07649.1 ABC-2 type transport system permease protein [Allostreptomyces psammosilenae]